MTCPSPDENRPTAGVPTKPRAHEISGLNTRGYNRIFVELLKSLPLEPESLIPQLRAALVRNTAASYRWPDDKEFSAAWRERPTYMVLNQARIRLVLLMLA